ncbi:MAG: hypothetical protein OHK0053_22490 [Microscillaceae bacterium]
MENLIKTLVLAGTGKILAALCIFLTGVPLVGAQVGGGGVYERKSTFRPEGKGQQVYLSDSTFLIEANILLNIPADEYVAVFGLAELHPTLAQSHARLNQRIKLFTTEMMKNGIATSDIATDYVTQAQIYDFELSGNVAQEVLKGFEVKKNVAVRFNVLSQIDTLIELAAAQGIYDLIKVDYIVRDLTEINARLFEEAFKVINRKKNRYLAYTQLKLLPQSKIYYENLAQLSPKDAYANYSAFESGDVNSNYYRNNSPTTVLKRKMKTFYFQPLAPSGYDEVINPVILAPVVQFSYTLRVLFEIAP